MEVSDSITARLEIVSIMMPTTTPTNTICNVLPFVNGVNRLSGMMLGLRIPLYQKGVYIPK